MEPWRSSCRKPKAPCGLSFLRLASLIPSPSPTTRTSRPHGCQWGCFSPWLSTRTPDTDDHRSSKRARVAAASEAILPEVSGRSREGEECAICLQDFAAEETLGAMPCSHAFHRHCISKWLCRSAASYPPLPSPRSTATTRWWNG
ncbi:hypothetical protein PVAP13_1KG061800 [Panicum virgatum]|uniref:RING-type domain-containing protein n=1 Tax=Panicum virgatum TaxID=38727 RepID=A0A8T0X9Q9_PANVG|nr:hypothetical protein PVAP13_1KG061800 [Panicum virgatum]